MRENSERPRRELVLEFTRSLVLRLSFYSPSSL